MKREVHVPLKHVAIGDVFLVRKNVNSDDADLSVTFVKAVHLNPTMQIPGKMAAFNLKTSDIDEFDANTMVYVVRDVRVGLISSLEYTL